MNCFTTNSHQSRSRIYPEIYDLQAMLSLFIVRFFGFRRGKIFIWLFRFRGPARCVYIKSLTMRILLSGDPSIADTSMSSMWLILRVRWQDHEQP